MTSKGAPEPAISVRGVGKRYRIYHRATDRLLERATGRPRARDFWALQDVSFDLYPGQSLGIIGRNGAGKSTLLQIIAGTLAPTTGEVHIRGRIAAMLELGSGFNPHFTGRENVILSGSIMGIPRRQMTDRFDEIEEFADIGEFIDEPVSTYSSGMHARLAFAVSVSLRPDILILDEILAVGDAAFQQKCIGRLHELLASGVTLLFVSHATDAVRSICKQGLLLAGGRQKFFGPAPEAVDRYFKIVREQQTARGLRRHEALLAALPLPEGGVGGVGGGGGDGGVGMGGAGDMETAVANEAPQEPLDPREISGERPVPESDPSAEPGGGGSLRYGSGHARVESVTLLDDDGRPRDGYLFGERVTVELAFRAGADLPKADAVIRVRDKAGIELFGLSVNDEAGDDREANTRAGGGAGRGSGGASGKLTGLKAGDLVRIRFRFLNNLRAGPHGVTVTLTRPPARMGDGLITLDHLDAAAAFVSLPQTGKLIRGKYQPACEVEWSVARAGQPSGV